MCFIRRASSAMAVRLSNKISFLVLCLALVLVFPAFAHDSSELAGRELYLSYGCAVCHGKNGEGDGINARLSNPAPTNFHNPAAYRMGSDKESIMSSIKDGIKVENSTMPAFEDIESKDLEKLADYLISLQNKN